jgi:hypothetical protein
MDVLSTPLVGPLKPLDGDVAALFVISHAYLVSGLSELLGRARGKETGEPNERRTSRKSSPCFEKRTAKSKACEFTRQLPLPELAIQRQTTASRGRSGCSSRSCDQS